MGAGPLPGLLASRGLPAQMGLGNWPAQVCGQLAGLAEVFAPPAERLCLSQPARRYSKELSEAFRKKTADACETGKGF